MASNETPKYKLSVVEGTELQLSLSGPAGPTGPAGAAGAAGPNTITSSTTTDKTGFIYGNGTNIAGATAATKDGTPNTLVLRSAEGAATFSTNLSSVPAVTGVNNSTEGGSAVYGYDYANDSGVGVTGQSAEGIGVYGDSSNEGTGVVGNSQNGTGVNGTGVTGVNGQGTSYGVSGNSSTGIGVIGTSLSGTGGKSSTFSGTYQHEFGGAGTLPDANNNRFKIERIRCWLVWFFSTFTGRLKTADITANRDWTLPDESGTVALARNTGKTIFVDAVTGNDTRGTISQYSVSIPFATIGAAIAASAIGDTVRVRAGSYTITSTITLNNEGNLHLEEGAVVTCSVAGAPVFTLSVDQAKVISGGGQFVINGTTTKFWQQTGGTTTNQLCSIECYSILQTSSTPIRIFEVTTGVLVVQTGTVYAPTSTIAYCEGTSSNVNYRVPFTYCARMVEMPTPTTQAQFSCVCQTIQCFGTKCFRVVGGTLGIDYETLVDAAGICTFFSFEYGSDATTNATSIRGGRAITYSANPCINFSTSTGTNKYLRFYSDPFFYTNGTNSITAASSRTVVSSTASSNKPVQGTVSIVGNYTVNPLFLY